MHHIIKKVVAAVSTTTQPDGFHRGNPDGDTVQVFTLIHQLSTQQKEGNTEGEDESRG